MLTQPHKHRFNNAISGMLFFAVIAVLLIFTGYRWGAAAAAVEPQEWSSYAFGPLYCVARAEQVRCVAQQVMTIEPLPQSLEQDTADTHASNANQQHECIALAIFTEARGESVLGQAAVAQTVVNRAKRQRKDACEVVTQIAQYQGLEHLRADPWLIDAKAWARAVQVATSVAMAGYDTGSCASATSFHRGEEMPATFADLREVCRVGAHRFYAEG